IEELISVEPDGSAVVVDQGVILNGRPLELKGQVNPEADAVIVKHESQIRLTYFSENMAMIESRAGGSTRAVSVKVQVGDDCRSISLLTATDSQAPRLLGESSCREFDSVISFYPHKFYVEFSRITETERVRN